MVDPADAGQAQLREVVDETERLRRQAHGDRRASSVPLLTFGVLTLAGGLNDGLDLDGTYWLLVGPVGFIATWWWYQRQEARTGVGPGRGSYLSIGVAVLLAVLFIPLGFVAPIPAVGLGLLVMAIRQRNRYLAGWALVIGIIGGLENWYLISNRLDELRYTTGYAPGPLSWSGNLTLLLAGLLLLAAGLVALRRERDQ